MSRIITRLAPKRVTLPTCVAQLGKEAHAYRDQSGRDYICGRTARYRIGDLDLCETHAGAEALRLLLASEEQA